MQSGAGIRKLLLGSFVTGTMLLVVSSVVVPTSFVWASSEKQAEGQPVDSGAFGIFMDGKRVGTESFSIHQSSTGSSITSDFKSERGIEKAAQSSQLQLTSNGELKSYEWKESSPGRSQATVTRDQEFLTERFTKTPEDKPLEQPFLLPASTNILDDYFFIQREVLAWKYLATTCRQEKGQVECPLKEPTQFGTLNAHSRQSMPVSVQYSGSERISIHGTERELIRLDIKSESGDWTLWLDQQLKLQRILDPTSNTEVIRD